MKITVAGCLHGHHPILEGGDLLILTGDYTARDTKEEFTKFFDWIQDIQATNKLYKKIIFIGGNHDMWMQKNVKEWRVKSEEFDMDIEYLCDSGTEYEGLKLYGFPHSLTFPNINPKCTAFTGDEQCLSEKCKLIPKDIDILISHSPPWGILDKIEDGSHVGSTSIRSVVLDKFTYPNLKYNLFSHIHEGYGRFVTPLTTFINCSIMNERYRPVNKPFNLEIE